MYASRVDNRVCDENACDELVVCLADFYFLFWFVGKRCLYKSYRKNVCVRTKVYSEYVAYLEARSSTTHAHAAAQRA